MSRLKCNLVPSGVLESKSYLSGKSTYEMHTNSSVVNVLIVVKLYEDNALSMTVCQSTPKLTHNVYTTCVICANICEMRLEFAPK